MVDNNAPKLWSISELEPDKDPTTLVEDLAKHFMEITNNSPALLKEEIPKSLVQDIIVLQLLQENVAKRIKKYKKT